MRKRCTSMMTAVMMILMILAAGCGGGSFDITPYDGTYWTLQGTDWAKGGYILRIDKDESAGKVVFTMEYLRGDPRPQHTKVSVAKKLSELSGNEVELYFDSDSWGKSGDIKLVFLDDKIEYTISNVKEPDGGANWGFVNDKGTLVPNDNPESEVRIHNDKYLKKVQVTPARSTASGILSQLGMTREQFKSSCIRIGKYRGTYAEVAFSDLLKYPNNYKGMHFRPNQAAEVFGKDTSADGYIVYHCLPNGNGWYEKEHLLIFDMRDDVQSPNISRGMYIEPYMIFTGIQTIDGIDYMKFNLIDVK